MSSEVPGEGPVPAKVMLVGEAPGAEEELKGHPFVGASGQELDRMLLEAGLHRSECFTTNVCRHRPPGNKIEAWMHMTKKKPPPGYVQMRQWWVRPEIAEGFQKLLKEIEYVKPTVIVALGNLSLWALTGIWGISKWRGSELRVDWDSAGPAVVPTWHPAYILRDWGERAACVRDLRRAGARSGGATPPAKPQWNFLIRPSFDAAYRALTHILVLLDAGPHKLVHDLETRHGHIACSGIAWSPTDAICIPFMCVERPEGYWSTEEEIILIHLHYLVLTHPNARVVNQNYLYDAQYTYRWWCFVGRFWRDSMISHHVAFCELPKALDYQASLYCEHYRYWKDDGRDWAAKMGEDQLWEYNCEDCVRTWEVDEVGAKNVENFNLGEVNRFQHSLFFPTLKAMQLGIRADRSRKAEVAKELKGEMKDRQEWLERVLGHPINIRSNPQMKALFYEDFAQPVIRNRKTKQPTLNDEALTKLGKREPLLRPIVKKIQELRSIGVFKSTFVDATLDIDGRLRCSFNPCGTYSFRYSSSESAFWNGTNFQNIPSGSDEDELKLPNIRKLFLPDEGMTFFDMDLAGADLQVVAWEADDEDLKRKLRLGVDMHCAAAVDIWDIKGIPVEELVKSHPNYREHLGRITEPRRKFAKGGVHATDYYCKAPTFASQFGTTIREAEKFINTWLGRHPGIKKWHERTAAKLSSKRPYVDNVFGYKWFVFGRPDLPAALAWQPQSVVGRVINTAWVNLHAHCPYIQVLLQVHDSLAGQFPTSQHSEALSDLRKHSTVTVPYSDPLVIPVGIKTSVESWGACQ